VTWILIALALWCVIAVLAVSLLAAAGHADSSSEQDESEPETEPADPRNPVSSGRTPSRSSAS
jgi:hypothetical protein